MEMKLVDSSFADFDAMPTGVPRVLWKATMDPYWYRARVMLGDRCVDVFFSTAELSPCLQWVRLKMDPELVGSGQDESLKYSERGIDVRLSAILTVEDMGH